MPSPGLLASVFCSSYGRGGMLHHFTLLLVVVVLCLGSGRAGAQQKEHLELESPFASYVEADFPFFTQTVDARKFGEAPVKENLTPRGIIIPAGNGIFACFDPDLLRWALIWQASAEGEYLTMDGMGTGSYRLPNRKSAAGQRELPRPLGTPLVSMPLRPGASLGEAPEVKDPRERGHAEAGELGLGPVPVSLGRFSGIRLVEGGVQLEYTVGETAVKERFLEEGTGAARYVHVGPRQKTLHLRAGPGEADWMS